MPLRSVGTDSMSNHRYQQFNGPDLVGINHDNNTYLVRRVVPGAKPFRMVGERVDPITECRR